MEKIDISSLIPTESKFLLGQFPGIEFKLTPCTGGKLAEMNKRFGNVEKLLAMPDAESVSKIALSLMEFESAKHFRKRKVSYIDPLTGDEVETEDGGFSLMSKSIAGLNEQWSVYEAILISLGYEDSKAKATVKQLKEGFDKAIEKHLGTDTKKKVVKKKKKK